MIRVAIAVSALILVMPAAARAGNAPDDPYAAAKAAGKAAVEAYLSALDAEKHEDSWEKTSSIYRKTVTKAEWIRHRTTDAERNGKLLRRELKQALYDPRVDSRYGPHETCSFIYDVRYEKAGQRSETIQMIKESDGVWRLDVHLR